MQFDSDPESNTINPKLLNREEYPGIPTFTSNITTALKAPGNGLSDLEDLSVSARNVGPDAGSGHGQRWVEIPEQGAIGDIDRSLNQARSAPSKAWEYEPHRTLHSQTGWAKRNNEPWNHLHTCAVSVPTPNYRSSWNSRYGATDQLPSNGTNPIGSPPLFGVSYRQTQTDDKYMSFMHHSSPDAQSVGYHDLPITPLPPTSSTNQVQFPNLNGDKSLAENSPRLRPPLIYGDEFSEEALKSEIEWDAEAHDAVDGGSMMWGVMDESAQMLHPDFANIPTSSGYSGQNNQTLSYMGREFNSAEMDFDFFDFDTHIHKSGEGFQHWPAENTHSPIINLNDGGSHPIETLDHPNAIRIPGSSNRFQSDLPSSFPPSAHCFPPLLLHESPSPHSLTSPRPRPRGSTVSTSQPTVFPSKQSNLATRRKPRNAPPPSRSRTNSLSIIQEGGQNALAVSPPGSKGKRKGALSPATAAAAAHTRAEKSVCIRCKVLKLTCKRDGSELSCGRCQNNYSARSWDQPCLKAHFLDVIEAETCDPIFQNSCSHMTVDGSQRLTLQYSLNFDIVWLLESLGSCQSRYNIEVVHYSGTTYSLDLKKTSILVSKIHDPLKEGSYRLSDFFDNKGVSLIDWVDCIKPSDDTPGVLDKYISYNDMPSHNGYHIVPLNAKAPPRPLDVEDALDNQAIRLAAQLCRIVLRALEISAFKALQKEVNELNKSSKSHTEIRSLVRQLAQVLISLRYRLEWWQQYGYGSTGYANTNTGLTDRVTKLAEVLYFWYFVAKARSSSSSRSAVEEADLMDDGSPTVDTLEGFHAWMRRND